MIKPTGVTQGKMLPNQEPALGGESMGPERQERRDLRDECRRGEVTRLTNEPPNDLMPAWSPDGTKIAFVFLPSKGPPQIHVMNADGTGVKALTKIPGGTDTPAWSPAPGAAG